MSRTSLVLAAAGGSAALLAAAFAFQYLGGLAPCELCLWQRWPHAAAVAIGAAALARPGALLPLLGGGAALATGGIGLYHTGVERGWWEGPAACAGGGDLARVSVDELTAQIMAAPLVRCDEVAWQVLGLSMASWNALAALALAALWLAAARRARGA
ncbi:disulfide bond formation protein B [Rhodosalinus sp. FB01]|uniref:disulfide bond formation protein B n=1 Tax=Rhodosalinus sp. FB01 TaxID=3239194 RepID=UPI0035239E51